ncbi:MAG: hypothetical protein R3B90_04430 [Planctomycetaceae bacterium]
MSHSAPHPDESLSAWIDGELTEEERAEVLARLEANADDQVTLAELEELGRDLRKLPRPATPPELRAGVMAQISRDRRTTTGSTAAAVPVNVTPMTRRNAIWGWSVAATLLTAAAALLIVLSRPGQWAETNVAMQTDAPANAASEAAPGAMMGATREVAELEVAASAAPAAAMAAEEYGDAAVSDESAAGAAAPMEAGNGQRRSAPPSAANKRTLAILEWRRRSGRLRS